MSKELEILKKHLGHIEGKGEFETKELCAQIDDANDFIGALQVLDNALKKLECNLKARNSATNEEQQSIDTQNNAIIENASFMSESLLGTEFRTSVGGERFSFECQNPFLVLENGGYEGVLAYVEDKREEINTLLDSLENAIALGDFVAPQLNGEFGSFKELLR